MAKTILSASVEENIKEAIEKLATERHRSFSNMTQLLLTEALEARGIAVLTSSTAPDSTTAK